MTPRDACPQTKEGGEGRGGGEEWEKRGGSAGWDGRREKGTKGRREGGIGVKE